MQSPNIVFGSALSIIAIGYLLKSTGILREYDAKYISKFLMYTTFPALVLRTMSQVELREELIWLPIIAFSFGIFSSIIGLLFFKNEKDIKNKGILVMGTSGHNLGLFAFPMIEGIWGLKGLAYAALFDIGNSFINLAYNFIVGTSISGAKNDEKMALTIIKKLASLAPFQAMILGLFINLNHLTIPTFASGILDVVASGNKPIVLLLMGIYFSVRLSKDLWIKVVKVLSIRYFLGLGLGLLIYYLSDFDLYFKNLCMIFLILPAGLTIITYSDILKFNTKIAGAIVNFSMVISFAFMWFLVYSFKMV